MSWKSACKCIAIPMMAQPRINLLKYSLLQVNLLSQRHHETLSLSLGYGGWMRTTNCIAESIIYVPCRFVWWKHEALLYLLTGISWSLHGGIGVFPFSCHRSLQCCFWLILLLLLLLLLMFLPSYCSCCWCSVALLFCCTVLRFQHSMKKKSVIRVSLINFQTSQFHTTDSQVDTLLVLYVVHVRQWITNHTHTHTQTREHLTFHFSVRLCVCVCSVRFVCFRGLLITISLNQRCFWIPQWF